MCGIVGYIGKKQAAPILLEGLKRLEYRGYDSAGIAVRGEKDVTVVKAQGRLSNLVERTEGGALLKGTAGIGHTRWATHGVPSECNAHPHTAGSGAITVVHNGILENFRELKEKLLRSGYAFRTETDTEVIVALIDYYYWKYKGGPIDAIARFMQRARGAYAIAVLFRDFPDDIFVARKDSPMIIGEGEGEMFAASDVPAILNHTRKVYYIGNLEMAHLTRQGVTFYNADRAVIERAPTLVDLDPSAAEKGGWEHFMIKEIHEQPRTVADTLSRYVSGGKIDFSEAGVTECAALPSHIVIVGCGSAYHVGVTLQYVIEGLARIPVRVELASEFRYRSMLFEKDTLVVAITQSGETADTLAAVREAKAHGIRTLAIVNVQGSSVAREADGAIFTVAGSEIAVATTKAYSAQLIVGYLLALELARLNGNIGEEKYRAALSELATLPKKIESILAHKEDLQKFAAEHMNMHDVFMIGRGIDYSLCMEGALKLKEVSYVHTEAYAAGELKHGTISLIEQGTVVLGVLSQSFVAEKTASNLEEVKSRGADVIRLCMEGCEKIGDPSDTVWSVPPTMEWFAASLLVVPLQLLAYYMSVQLGHDVDKPRNLAKSVTVE